MRVCVGGDGGWVGLAVPMDMAKLQWFGPWLLRQSLRRPKGAKLFSLGYPEMSKMFPEGDGGVGPQGLRLLLNLTLYL